MIDTKNLIIQHKGNNAFVIDTKNKSIHVLIWNAIEQKFNNIPLKYDELRNIVREEQINTKSVKIEVNEVIHSVPYQHTHIIELFEKYDSDNYKTYDHTELNNRALNGLSKPDDHYSDDYIWYNKSIIEIEENCNNINTSYDQSYGINKELGAYICWRPQ